MMKMNLRYSQSLRARYPCGQISYGRHSEAPPTRVHKVADEITRMSTLLRHGQVNPTSISCQVTSPSIEGTEVQMITCICLRFIIRFYVI